MILQSGAMLQPVISEMLYQTKIQTTQWVGFSASPTVWGLVFTTTRLTDLAGLAATRPSLERRLGNGLGIV
jgi:hypothetical protein